MKRTATLEEIKPLIEMCKGGRLFEVQAWIASGKPVNPPEPPKKGRRPHTPLQIAIDSGFYSLVQILLDGGAEIEHIFGYADLHQALWQHKFDIVKLLVDHGADIKAVNMTDVFSTWDPKIMEYFIELGSDVETGNPLAEALCARIRPTLSIYKKYQDRFPSFQEQANIALRQHCKEWNRKWVFLMLWVGADPYKAGPDEPNNKPSPEIDQNALEIAAFYERWEFFRIRYIHLDPKHERAHELMKMVCFRENVDLLKRLLDLGFEVNDQENGGSSSVEQILDTMSYYDTDNRTKIDTPKTVIKLEMLNIMVNHGARWIPADPKMMNYIRKSLLGVTADHIVEAISIMAKHGACSRSVIKDLLKLPSMREHLKDHWKQIEQLVAKFPEAVKGAKS